MAGCGAGNSLTKKKSDAEAYYISGDYTSALTAYQEIISVYENNNNSIECPVYTKAGESSYKTGNPKLAIQYLKNDEGSKFLTEDTYYYLAKSYNEIDNLSLELMTLKDYVTNYPDGRYIGEMEKQLFLTYVESENYEPALEMWPKIRDNNPDNSSMYEAYFTVNQGLNNVDTCMSISHKLLKIDSENVQALEWLGKHYYRKAEDRYQKEMKAYDKKKTNKQYRILLKALDVVTADFKTSLKYFKELYSANPKAEYANYLSHIYNRLSDKKKAEYYKKLAK